MANPPVLQASGMRGWARPERGASIKAEPITREAKIDVFINVMLFTVHWERL